MEKFTASNNLEVVRKGSHCADMVTWEVNQVTLGTHEMAALREFFLHERDQELGRWRWPENPYLVVQIDKGGERAWVVNERNQQITGWVWRVDLDHSTAHAQVVAAARAYFAAHPEPKPWHDAKRGEVWAISTTVHKPEFAVHVSAPNTTFRSAVGFEYELTDASITAGRRIWPEVE